MGQAQDKTFFVLIKPHAVDILKRVLGAWVSRGFFQRLLLQVWRQLQTGERRLFQRHDLLYQVGQQQLEEVGMPAGHIKEPVEVCWGELQKLPQLLRQLYSQDARDKLLCFGKGKRLQVDDLSGFAKVGGLVRGDLFGKLGEGKEHCQRQLAFDCQVRDQGLDLIQPVPGPAHDFIVFIHTQQIAHVLC